jgi:hypothetical protein
MDVLASFMMIRRLDMASNKDAVKRIFPTVNIHPPAFDPRIGSAGDQGLKDAPPPDNCARERAQEPQPSCS